MRREATLAAALMLVACTPATPPPRAWNELVPQPASVVQGDGAFTGTSPTTQLDPSLSELGPEGYELTVTTQRATVRAMTPAGVFYGSQTFSQLGSGSIATGVIRDAPRFAWRGLMVDLARHFFGLSELKRLVDLMARFKLNRLHLHLTDDQGWRLELASRPSLTTLGAATQVGGGPSGFLSRADYLALVTYAEERFVTVVPELDVPGHTNAALASLRELNCDGVAKPPYTGVAVGLSTLCASRPETQAFLVDVFTELATLTPGQWIHLGGDEAKMTSLADYQSLTSIARSVIESHGKTVIGWEELARADAGAGTIVQHWLDPALAATAGVNGAQLIVSPAKHAYLDMQYALDTPSPTVGTFWAGFVDVRAAYDWDPLTIVPGVPESSILGVEAAVWTETIATPEELDSMIFPRLLSLAELAWSPASSHDVKEHLRRLAAQGPMLEDAGVRFFKSSQVRWP